MKVKIDKQVTTSVDAIKCDECNTILENQMPVQVNDKNYGLYDFCDFDCLLNYFTKLKAEEEANV